MSWGTKHLDDDNDDDVSLTLNIFISMICSIYLTTQSITPSTGFLHCIYEPVCTTCEAQKPFQTMVSYHIKQAIALAFALPFALPAAFGFGGSSVAHRFFLKEICGT